MKKVQREKIINKTGKEILPFNFYDSGKQKFLTSQLFCVLQPFQQFEISREFFILNAYIDF
jgi:hypothetical protein